MKRHISAALIFCIVALTTTAFAATGSGDRTEKEIHLLKRPSAGHGDKKQSHNDKADKEKTNYKVKAIEDSLKRETSWQNTVNPNGKAVLPEGIEAAPVRPLKDELFVVGGLRKGMSAAEVLQKYGQPQERSETTHFLKLVYRTDDLGMRVVLRKPVAESLRLNNIDNGVIETGVESVFLTKSDTLVIGEDITLGSPVELLVRRFGVPDTILRDNDANVYYFVYSSQALHEDVIFAVGDRKIQRVAMMPPRMPYAAKNNRALPYDMPAKEDFTLMGFAPAAPFTQNKYNTWQTVIKRGHTNFWLYGDYGVEVDSTGTVHNVFLLSNSAFTGRGITLGYHVSTLLAAYGVPNRIDIGPDTEDSVDAYYYDSPFDRGTSLVFILKHDKHYISDIILTDRPIKDLQDSLGRYDLKGKKAIPKEYT